MPDNRPSVQVNQPDIINSPETNWPTPLVDPSGKLKVAVTNGSNGSQRDFKAMSTSQQDAGEHHLSEGKPNSGATNDGQGGHSDKLKTSQQNAGDHQTAEGAD